MNFFFFIVSCSILFKQRKNIDKTHALQMNLVSSKNSFIAESRTQKKHSLTSYNTHRHTFERVDSFSFGLLNRLEYKIDMFLSAVAKVAERNIY